jgi:catabolite regulation protein CreA
MTFHLIGANVCVSAFDDPKVPGVAYHISRTGGAKGSLHDRRMPVNSCDMFVSADVFIGETTIGVQTYKCR